MIECRYCGERFDNETHSMDYSHYCGSYYNQNVVDEKFQLYIGKNHLEIHRYALCDISLKDNYFIINGHLYRKIDYFSHHLLYNNTTLYTKYSPFSSVKLPLNLRDIYSQYNCDKDLYNHLNLLLLFS